MSDTPKTDAFHQEVISGPLHAIAARYRDYARDLERENAKLREDVNFGDKERRDAISDLAAANERAERAEQELVNISRTSQGVLLTEAQYGWHKSQMKYLEMTERCRVAEAQSDALRKALEEAVTTLTSMAKVFRHYEQLHLAKGPEGGMKAMLNANHALSCETTLTAAKSALGQPTENNA